MTTHSELLPCPLCGSPTHPVKLNTWLGEYGYWSAQAHCLDCHLTVDHSALTEDDAVAALLKHWNTRPAQPVTVSEGMVDAALSAPVSLSGDPSEVGEVLDFLVPGINKNNNARAIMHAALAAAIGRGGDEDPGVTLRAADRTLTIYRTPTGLSYDSTHWEGGRLVLQEGTFTEAERSLRWLLGIDPTLPDAPRGDA